MVGLLQISLLLAYLLGCIHGNSDGAPGGACDEMNPGHINVPAQNGTSPYAIHLSAQQFSWEGEEIIVTLYGASQFKGFLCQPRPDPSIYSTSGSLTAIGDVPMTNNCGMNASLTHTDNSPKSSVSFIWRADKSQQDLQIVCTILQSGGIFWLKTTSDIISYVAGQCERP